MKYSYVCNHCGKTVITTENKIKKLFNMNDENQVKEFNELMQQLKNSDSYGLICKKCSE